MIAFLLMENALALVIKLRTLYKISVNKVNSIEKMYSSSVVFINIRMA